VGFHTDLGSDVVGRRFPPNETGGSAVEDLLREDHCLEVLRTCCDPELPANVVDLGLIYACRVTPLPEGGHEVVVQMTLTSPGWPMSDVLKREIEEKLSDLCGVKRVGVELVFDPPWARRECPRPPGWSLA